ncbi:MAG: MATE family efflux transporter [Anaerolineales bacterium]
MRPANGLGRVNAVRLRTTTALRNSALGCSAALETLRLALPAAGEQLLAMMVGIVDTFLVGHIGAAALAAVGLANQWVMLTNALFGAIGVGSTALIARSVGAKDTPLANRVLRQSVLVGAAIGITATVLGVTLARPAVALMGAEPEALGLGTTYLRIVAAVFLPATLIFICNAALRGAGDTRTPLRIMFIVNGINIVVAWSLINGAFGLPRMGVAGSAIGAATARLIGGVLAMSTLARGRGALRLVVDRLRPDWDLIRRILRVGIPSGLEQLLFRFGQMSYARVVATLGTAAFAAHQVALNAESLSYMPGFGFAVAATTLVGQALGAQNPKAAERNGYTAFALGAALMGLMGIVFILIPLPLVSFFTSDPEVIALGTTPLRIVGLAQPALAATMIINGALRGAGDTKYPLYIVAGCIWGIRVPLAILFISIMGLGLSWAWVAMCTDLLFRGLFAFLRYRGGKWKTIQV